MRIIKLWVPVFSWCALIFYLSGVPQLTTGWGVYDFALRKIAHMAEYFILALLLYRAFKGSFNLAHLCLIICSFISSFLYAISDEMHQAFVPTREARIGDVLIDTIGIIIFCALVKYKKEFREKVMFWI